jgi:hypothetical protein
VQNWRASGSDEVLVSLVASVLRAVPITALLIGGAAHASPGERDKLNACQALVDRAAQTQQTGAVAAATPDDAELARCCQIIREWTLRDSRMIVDEQGRPLR